jgi:hypothetical protein
MHLEYFNDYILANTALILSHGKLFSIYDFKTMEWDHIVPKDENREEDHQECYFGMPNDEIKCLTLNHIFPNAIYDCFVQYQGSYLRRLKYFNENNKTCFEKKLIFKDQTVH